ncbi:MAG: hypothetical protein WDN25_01170 [Acetobacteraceae bacterium]
MRRLLPLLAALLLALPAAAPATLAQTMATQPGGAATGSPQAGGAQKPGTASKGTPMSMERRFEQANVTNDGHLTLEQAKTKYKAVARHFAAIDKDNKGYVTLDDIRGYDSKRRTLHQEPAATRRDPKG